MAHMCSNIYMAYEGPGEPIGHEAPRPCPTNPTRTFWVRVMVRVTCPQAYLCKMLQRRGHTIQRRFKRSAGGCGIHAQMIQPAFAEGGARLDCNIGVLGEPVRDDVLRCYDRGLVGQH